MRARPRAAVTEIIRITQHSPSDSSAGRLRESLGHAIWALHVICPSHVGPQQRRPLRLEPKAYTPKAESRKTKAGPAVALAKVDRPYVPKAQSLKPRARD